MRFAFWVNKATDTLRICNTFLIFHCNNGYRNAPQCYVIRTLPVIHTLLGFFVRSLSVLHHYFFVLIVLAFYFLSLLDNTNIHAPGGFRIRNPRKRSTANPRLRPLGHSDGCLKETESRKACLVFRCVNLQVPGSVDKCLWLPNVALYFVGKNINDSFVG